MALVDVYDGAYYHPMSGVPSSVKAIIGYVSGPGATHIWPPSDCQSVRNSGREFWSIDVPSQGGFSSSSGTASANRMIAALPNYNRPKSCPVFTDLEYNAYMANPAGGDAHIAAFRSKMNAAGYSRAYGYTPLLVGGPIWGARYTYSRPSSLPRDVVGWQYENDAYRHPGWDASVFQPTLLGSVPPPVQPDPPADPMTDLLGADMTVWWFGRTDDGKIWAINSLTGRYFHVRSDHNLSVFKEWLVTNKVPYDGSVVSIAGNMSQFGVEMADEVDQTT